MLGRGAVPDIAGALSGGNSCRVLKQIVFISFDVIQGDLKQYLRNHGKDSEHQIPSEYVLLWCYQLTSALKHLHMNKLTHP